MGLPRIARRLRNAVQTRWLRGHGIEVGPGIRLHGRPLIYRAPDSRIAIGARVVLTGRNGRNSLDSRGPCILRTLAPGAELLVGDDCGMSSVTIAAATRIVIGHRVMLGAGTILTDSDHHRLDVEPRLRRSAGMPAGEPGHAIHIGDDVFIGTRSIILKGVSIGSGAIIGAGSVVTRDIPRDAIAGGNPCRVVGKVGSA